MDNNIKKVIKGLHKQGKSVKQIINFLKKKNIEITKEEVLLILDEEEKEYNLAENIKDLPEKVEQALPISANKEVDLYSIKQESIILQAILVRQLSSFVFKLDPSKKQFTRYARLLNEANYNLNRMLEKVELEEEIPQQITFEFKEIKTDE